MMMTLWATPLTGGRWWRWCVAGAPGGRRLGPGAVRRTVTLCLGRHTSVGRVNSLMTWTRDSITVMAVVSAGESLQ